MAPLKGLINVVSVEKNLFKNVKHNTALELSGAIQHDSNKYDVLVALKPNNRCAFQP